MTETQERSELRLVGVEGGFEYIPALWDQFAQQAGEMPGVCYGLSGEENGQFY